MESAIHLITQIRWRDVLDILMVTAIVVWLYLLVRGTRAFRILLGLGLVVIIYLFAHFWGLVLTEWFLQGLVQAVILFILIIFAPEIRQALERLNPLRIWNRPAKTDFDDEIEEVVRACQYFVAHSIGAMIVYERNDSVAPLVRPGIPVQGRVREETLVALFITSAPTHDGAAWIRDDVLHQIGVFLPISERDHSKKYGSRHLAALGLSESSDALVVVVSEERRVVSVVQDGRLEEVDDWGRFESILREELGKTVQLRQPTLGELISKEWRVKVATLLLVTLAWFTVAGGQEIEGVYAVQIQTVNLPEHLSLALQPVDQAFVTLSGTRLALARLDSSTLRIFLDLSDVTPATLSVPIHPSRIHVPPNIQVARIEPQAVAIEVETR